MAQVEAGQMLGHYRLGEKIAEGGMGVVWEGRDTTLDRQVAIKILPEAFAEHPERLARFEREAKLLASMNHPNIAVVHGLHEHEGVRFLAMELIPGEDLQQRLSRGGMPVAEALDIAAQLARALEAAHEQGVIHRDLKPGNIKLTPEGQIKVLDFGLAKAFEPDSVASGSMPTMSPTLTSAGTVAGVVLGTAAYMSPEQARGHQVDKRTDIWAFGVVLFEMLSGCRAFQGETISDTLASVLKVDPLWDALPDDTPESAVRLMRRCLEKNPKQRLRDIGEARIRMEEAVAAPETPPAEAPAAGAAPSAGRPVVPWVVAALAVVAALVAFVAPWRGGDPPAQVMRLDVEISGEPLGNTAGAVGVPSPDGSRIAYVAGSSGLLHVRLVDQLEGTALSGTEGARNPFFSPDGEWIGFFADRKLKKVAVVGGAPQTLCDVRNHRGGTWGPDDTIVFSPHVIGGLYRVPATGGEPEQLTDPDVDDDRSHRWPRYLPDGRSVVFTAQHPSESFNESRIHVLDVASGEHFELHRGGSYPAYVPTGHLVYVREATVFAAPFAPGARALGAPPAPVLEGVSFDSRHGGAQLAFSASGHLLYREGGVVDADARIGWLDRDGTVTTLLDEPRDYGAIEVSPDGRFVAFNFPGEAGTQDIWIHDVERDVMARLTFSDGDDTGALFTPDGRHVIFNSTRDGGAPALYRKRADGTGEAERLAEAAFAQFAVSVTPDGTTLLFAQNSEDSQFDMWTMSLDGDAQPRLYLSTHANEGAAMASPDGRWVAHGSDISGSWQVYVRPFPEGQGKWQVSTGDVRGTPRWSPDGSRLYYLVDGDLMTVEFSATGDSPTIGRQEILIEDALPNAAPFGDWTVHPDGERFVHIIRAPPEVTGRDTQLTLVVNWFDELRERAPRRR